MHNIWFSKELKKDLESTFSKEKLFDYFSKIYDKKVTDKMFDLRMYTFIGKDYSIVGDPSENEQIGLVNKYGGINKAVDAINNYHSNMLQKYAGMRDPEDYNTMPIPVRVETLDKMIPEIKSSIEKGERVNPKSLDEALAVEQFSAGIILGPRLIESPGGSIGGYY